MKSSYHFTAKILNEERDERLFAKMEQQIAKSEISLRGMEERERNWFQSMKKRKEETDRLTNSFRVTEKARKTEGLATNDKKRKGDADISKLSESKRKKKEAALKTKTPSQVSKERYIKQRENSSFIRAKALKSQNKPRRLNALDDNDTPQKQSFKNKKTSKFSQDLTDTSRRNAKRLRYVFIHFFEY